MKIHNSEKLIRIARKNIPGGVNSPVRAFKSVGGTPIFIERGEGSKIYDVDGNKYIDYVCSWGPLILGHVHKDVIKAIKEATIKGTSFGAPTEAEVKLAELVKSAFHFIDLIRFVNSGTEAVMSAIRLARAYTKKDKIIKFEGCYHGHSDSLLTKAGSGLATFAIPGSPGVPLSLAKLTVNLPYNNVKIFEETIEKHHQKIACVIIEPVAANMGVVLPEHEFLEAIRRLTKEKKIVLIFDEVITGFRIDFGGVSTFYRIKPDLICLGKIIGGGLPVGAYGGKKEIMNLIAPDGPVYQAGTLSGNPIATAAGLATLTALKRKMPYRELEEKGKFLEHGIKNNLKKLKLNLSLNRIGSILTLFFTDKPVYDYDTALTSNTEKYAKYFHEMLKRGIYLPPSQFEALFISTVHTKQDLEKTIKANFESLKAIK